MSYPRRKNSSLSAMLDHNTENPIIKSALSGKRRFLPTDNQPVYKIVVPKPEPQEYFQPQPQLRKRLMKSEPPPMTREKDCLPDTKIKRNYSCSKCAFFTQNPRTNLYHHRDVHGDRGNIFECTSCLYASKHAQKLQRHIRMCHEPQPHDEIENEDQNENESHPEVPEVSEEEQNEGQGSDEEEEETIESQQEIKEESEGLRLRSSESSQPPTIFKCKTCEYETGDKLRYKKHVKGHSSSMIKCSICDFKTPYKWNLDRHLKNHNSGGSLKCPICNFSADIKQSIGVHIQNHHHSLSDAKIEELLKAVLTKKEPEVEPDPEVKFSDSLPILVDETGQPDESRLNFINPEDILEKNGKIYFKKLKCPKANCDFRAVWETELNRHLSRAHSISTQRRSMPTLHPIVPISQTQTQGQVETPSTSTPKPKPTSASINYPKKRSLFLDNLSQRLQKAAKAQVRTKTALQSLEMSRSARRQSNSNEKEGINGKIWDDYSGIEIEQGVGVIRAIHHRNVDVTEFEPTTRRVFKCPHNNCTFWTTTAPRFHVHIIDHSGKRPFECSICHYKSNWSWDITKHIRMKGAKDAGHLRARVLVTNTETGEKNHKDYDKYLIPMKITMDSGEKRSNSRTPPKATTSKNIAPKPKAMPKVEPAAAAVIGTPDVKPNIPQAQGVLPKMPTLTRAPSHIFAQAIAKSSTQGKSSSSPPILKQSSDCRTFVDKNMLSGGQMLQQAEQKSTSVRPQLQKFPSGAPRPQKSPHGFHNGNFETNGSPPLKRLKLSEEEEKLKRWKCKMCPFRHEDKSAVVVHIRQFHKKDKETFLKMNEPNIANIESPSPPRPVIKAQDTPIIRETHQYTYGDDMFKCKFCPFKAKVLRLMEAHSENHFSKQHHHYACEHCSFSSRTEKELNEHIALHLGNGNDPNSPSHVILPEETPPKPPGAGSTYKKYHCIECPYVTDSRGQFQYHRQFHQTRQDSPYKCNHCSYSVSHKHLLHQHTRVHFAKTSETNGNGSINGADDADVNVVNGNGNGHRKTPTPPPPPKAKSKVSEDHPTVLMWRDGIAYKVYRCRSCPQIFEGLPDLLQHESSHLPENENEDEAESELELQQQELPPRNQELRLALCKFCPARFFNAKDLVIHASFHRIRSTHRCQACSYSVKSRTHLDSHMKVHGLEYQKKTQEYFLKLNKIRCPRCPARLANEPSFQHHYGFHGRNTGFNCGHCDFGADSANNLMLHEFIHAIMAEKTGRIRSTVGIPQRTIASGETVITEFEMDTEPKQRMRRSYRNDDEACQGNPEFSYPTYVKNGKEKEKRYKCKLCPSAFEKRDQYNVHMGLHGSNQRYRCTICDYSVTYFANFAQHLKKHQTQPEIPKELLMALATPISKMGNGSPIPNLRCSSCPFFTETQKELVEHQMQHGRNSPGLHPCQFCDFAAIDNKSLVRHTKCHFQNVTADSYMFAPQGIDLIDPRNGQKTYSEKENHTAISHASASSKSSKDSGRMTYVDMVKALPIDMYGDEDEDEEDENEGEEEEEGDGLMNYQ